MATVNVFTAERMAAIEAEAITGARLDGFDLVLIRNNEEEINVGDVRGPAGATPTVPDEINWDADGRVAGASPIGGPGTPPLKFQAGTKLIETNTEGRAVITFPSAFLGISSVIAQVGELDDVIFTHINGTSVGTTGLSVENLQLIVDDYTLTTFRVTLGYPGGAEEFGVPVQGVRVGGSSEVRVNWMAFGW